MRVRERAEAGAEAGDHCAEPGAAPVVHHVPSANPARELAAALRTALDRGRRDRALHELAMRRIDPEWRSDEVRAALDDAAAPIAEGDPPRIAPRPEHALEGDPAAVTAAANAEGDHPSPHVPALRLPLVLAFEQLRPPRDPPLRVPLISARAEAATPRRAAEAPPVEPAPAPEPAPEPAPVVQPPATAPAALAGRARSIGDPAAAARRDAETPSRRTKASPVQPPPIVDIAGKPLQPGATVDGKPLAKEDDAAAAAARTQAEQLHVVPVPEGGLRPAMRTDAGLAGEMPRAGAAEPGAAEPGAAKAESARPPAGEKAAGAPGAEVAVAGGEPAGGTTGSAVAAWKSRVAASTSQVKEPAIPDSERYVLSIRQGATDPNAARKAKLKTLEEEGKKAITPAKDPPQNLPAIPEDPTHKASAMVDALCGKTIVLDPPATLPDLVESPYGHVPVLGARVRTDEYGLEFVELPPVEGEKGAKPERIYRPGGIRPLDDNKAKKWDELQARLAKAPPSNKRALGKGVTVQQENPPPPVVVPPFARVDVGDVLARLLAEPDQFAKQSFDQARKSFYKGVLDEVPNQIGKGLEQREAPAFAAELQRVADAAGIKKEELDKKVEERRKVLLENKQGGDAALSKAHEQARQDIANSGKEMLDAIASVRARIDDEGERRAAAAKGGVDVEEQRRKRDAMYTAIDDKVARWLVIYDAAGKRFRQGLDKAKAEQMQAYTVAARQDEWLLKKDAGNDKEKLEAAQKTYNDTTEVWRQQRSKEIDKVVVPARRKIGQIVEAWSEGLRDAGQRAHREVLDWYDTSIGYERSWLSRLLEWVQGWLGQAKKESAAWENARAAETSEALNKDMNFLAEARLRYGEELDAAAIDSMRGLGEEQKAILKEYYKEGGRDSVQALAVGIATRIRLQRQPEILKALEDEVTASDNEALLVAVGNKQTPGFESDYLNRVMRIRQGVEHTWGTDEEKIFKALGGLTKIQARAIELCYERTYHEPMRARLKSELDDAFSTSHDWDKAQALMAGDQDTVAAVELNEAMEGTFLGTGWGTDEDKIFEILRGKTPEQIDAIKKAYKARYGKDLDAQIKDELGSGPGETAHDVEEAGLLMEGKIEEAQAVEMDRAMRGTFLGTGAGTDEKALQGVYERIKREVEAEGQRAGWSAATIRAEIARRNAGLDAAFEKRYGREWTDRKPGESALRAAFREELSGADLNLVVGMADQDWKKVDAARIQIEHESIWYADDAVIRDAMSAQYRRDIADARIDGYLAVDRTISVEKEIDASRVRSIPPPLSEAEKAKGVITQFDFLEKWRADKLHERRKQDRKQVDKDAEKAARKKAPENLAALAAQFEGDYRNLDPDTGKPMTFADVVRMDTMGADNDAVEAMLTKGYLTAAEEVQFAIQGPGTDEDKLKEVLKGKTRAEIEEIATAWAQKHPADPGDKRTDFERFRDRIAEELSGRDEADIMEMVEHGEPQTPEEELARLRRRAEFEGRSTNRWAAGERALIDTQIQFMERYVDDLRKHEANRPQLPDKILTRKEAEEWENKLRTWDEQWEDKNAAIERQREIADDAVQIHREGVDAITDAIVTVVTVVVLVVITVVVAIFTAGAGVAAIGAALSSAEFLVGTALATAAATIITKAALKGDAYGWEEIGYDATVGIVDAIAARYTAGLGSRFLKLGFLARMANEGGMFARVAAHGLAQGAEGLIQGLPSALAGNVLNDNNYKQGNALGNILGGTLLQAAPSAAFSGMLGMVGGISKPKHMVGAADLAALKAHPENEARLFAAYKEQFPGATVEKFRTHLDEAILKNRPDLFFSETVQSAMKKQLLEHVPAELHPRFKDMPIEVVPAAEFKKLTGSEAGQAVTMFRRGKPSIVIKAGADLSVLGEEGIHLLQQADKRTADLIKSLDEKALKNWKKLPMEQKVELYRNKLHLEIDAHEKLVLSLEAKKGVAVDAAAMARQLDEAKRTLGELRSRLSEVRSLRPVDLEQPPRLFNKPPPPGKPGSAHPTGVETRGPPSEATAAEAKIAQKERVAPPEVKARPAAEPEVKARPAAEPEVKARPEAELKAEAEAKAKAKTEAEARVAQANKAAGLAEAKKVELEAHVKQAELDVAHKVDAAGTREIELATAEGKVKPLADARQSAKQALADARANRAKLEAELKGTTGAARAAKQAEIDAAALEVEARRKLFAEAGAALDDAERAVAAARKQAKLAARELDAARTAVVKASREAERAAKDAAAAIRRARIAAKEPGHLEYTTTRPDRSQPAIKKLEGAPLSDADALQSSFGRKVKPELGEKVHQVGPAWREGDSTYRIVEHVGPDGKVKAVHEEIFGERGWVKRGTEAERLGEQAERASRLKTDELLGDKLIDASKMEKGVGRGSAEYVRFETQTARGHGFDDVLVRFEPGKPPTVHAFEVKHYEGLVPAHEFTAVGPNLKKNLGQLKAAVTASNLSDLDKQLVRDAIDNWRVQIELRLTPGGGLQKDAMAWVTRAVTALRDIDIARRGIVKKVEAGALGAELEAAVKRFDAARDRFQKAIADTTGSTAARKALADAEQGLKSSLSELSSKHGIDMTPPGVHEVSVIEGKIDVDQLKRTPAYVDFRATDKQIDHLTQRIGEPAVVKQPPVPPGTGPELAAASKPPPTRVETPPARIEGAPTSKVEAPPATATPETGPEPPRAESPAQRADDLALRRGDLSARAHAARRGDLEAEVDALRDEIEALQALAREGGIGLEADLAARELQMAELSRRIAEAEAKVPIKETAGTLRPTLDPKADPARRFVEGHGGGTLQRVELPPGSGVSVDDLFDMPPARLRKLLSLEPDEALRTALGLGKDVNISKTRDAITTVVKVVEQAERLMQKLRP